jgi:outer membrane protein assembly factor BamE
MPAMTPENTSAPTRVPTQPRCLGISVTFGACLAMALAMQGCSTLSSATEKLGGLGNIGNVITPYKMEVVQGNFVSKEQKEALQEGMQRAQVRDILGSPLVTSAFHADRWDYVFTIRRQGQEPQQRKLTVFFKGDELAKVESDPLMSEEEFVGSLSVGRRLGKVPQLEAQPEALREFGAKNTAANSAVAPANTAQSASNSGAPASYPPLESAPK